MQKKDVLKIAIISGAAHALDYKSKNIRATDAEALQHVAKESNKIIEKLDVEI
jgi:hypothetical protein